MTVLHLVSAKQVETIENIFRAKYVDEAASRVKSWPVMVLAAAKKIEEAGVNKYSLQHSNYTRGIMWSKWFEGERPRGWEGLVERATAGITINRSVVARDAENAANGAIDFFNARVSEKIESVIGGLIDEAEVESVLSVDQGVLTGTVSVTVKGFAFTLGVSLKTNYRYGENSANGVLTVYNQVPCIINMEDGERPVRTPTTKERQTEAEKQAKNDIKAQIAAMDAEILATMDATGVAQKARELYNDIKSLERNLRKVEKEGIKGIDFISAQLLDFNLSDSEKVAVQIKNLGDRIDEIKADNAELLANWSEKDAVAETKAANIKVRELRAQIKALK